MIIFLPLTFIYKQPWAIMNNEFPFSNFLKLADNNNDNDANPSLLAKKSLNNNDLSQDVFESKKDEKGNLDDIKLIEYEILSNIKASLTSQKYHAYIENCLSLKSIELEKINFSASTPFIKNIIQTHYLNILKDSVVSVLGKEYKINILVTSTNESLSSNNKNILKSINDSCNIKPQISSAKNASFSLDLTPSHSDLVTQAESELIKHMDSDQLNIAIDPKKTFSSFVVGHSNNIAYASAQAVSKKPGTLGEYPSLYIYSNSGLGKTHLLHAIANEIKHNYPKLRICIMTGREFMNEFVNSFQSNTNLLFRKKYSEEVDILMIDDIHEFKGKKGTQDEFFHVFNELHGKGKQLVFTSDQHPTEIDGISERIVTRLQWGLCVDIQQPDFETRIAILKSKAQELDLFLSDDIFSLIASSIKKNIRALEGSLIHLHAFSSFMKTELDIELVKQALRLNNMAEPEDITLDRVAKVIAKHYRFTIVDLKSKTRKQELVKTRHIAMYLSQKMTKSTLSEIGSFYGGRDHSTVINAIKNIEDRLKIDVELSRDIVTIENNL